MRKYNQQENSEPGMGFKTRKMLKDFINSLRDTASKSPQDAPAPYVPLEYEEEEGSEKSNEPKVNTDRKIRALWENLKKQMMKYDSKPDIKRPNHLPELPPEKQER